MAGLSGISAYQQSGQSWKTGTDRAERSGAETKAAKTGEGRSVQNANPAKVEMKKWSPIDPASSLVPRKTEYGMTIGDVKLSDKAKAWTVSSKGREAFNKFKIEGDSVTITLAPNEMVLIQ